MTAAAAAPWAPCRHLLGRGIASRALAPSAGRAFKCHANERTATGGRHSSHSHTHSPPRPGQAGALYRLLLSISWSPARCIAVAAVARPEGSPAARAGPGRDDHPVGPAWPPAWPRRRSVPRHRLRSIHSPFMRSGRDPHHSNSHFPQQDNPINL